jgi:hypothetical protein
VKYLLTMHMNPTLWDSLTEDQQSAVMQGHDDFQKIIIESGEMVGTKALDSPANTITVRVRDGITKATDGPYVEGDEFLCGYYVVECRSQDRASELAALIPDAQYTAVEVRPIVHEAGPE